MDSKADQRRLTVKALGSGGLPTLKLPNQRCQAQRFEIADFLFGRALTPSMRRSQSGIFRFIPACTKDDSDVPELVLQALASRPSVFALGHRFQPPQSRPGRAHSLDRS